MKAPVYNESWSEGVKRLYDHDMREIWDPDICRHIYNQYNNQLDIYTGLVNSYGDSLDILDIGCAQATLAMRLAELGHNVVAVDIRQEFLDYAVSRYTDGNIKYICANVMEDEIEGKYDLVFANQILEHLVYPVEFLEKLKKHTRPGSRIVVTTPNHDYLVCSHPAYTELGDPSDYEDRQFTADGDGHFFAYTKKELIDIAQSAGLQVEKFQYFETPWISGHMKIRYMHGFIPRAILLLMDRVSLAMPWVGRVLSHQQLMVVRN